jgi:hypothetical protein
LSLRATLQALRHEGILEARFNALANYNHSFFVFNFWHFAPPKATKALFGFIKKVNQHFET